MTIKADKSYFESIGCKTSEQLFKEFNIDLTNNTISHCNKLMTTGQGIIGTDIIECKECGLTIINLLSPHVNGGYVFDIESDVNNTWIRVDNLEEQK